jgi:hypothetical protein
VKSGRTSDFRLTQIEDRAKQKGINETTLLKYITTGLDANVFYWI